MKMALWGLKPTSPILCGWKQLQATSLNNGFCLRLQVTSCHRASQDGLELWWGFHLEDLECFSAPLEGLSSQKSSQNSPSLSANLCTWKKMKSWFWQPERLRRNNSRDGSSVSSPGCSQPQPSPLAEPQSMVTGGKLGRELCARLLEDIEGAGHPDLKVWLQGSALLGFLGFGVLTAEAVLEGEKRKSRRPRQAVVLLEHSFPAGPSLLVMVAFVPGFSLVSE